MNLKGFDLATLTRRLAETPPDFMDEPFIAASGCGRVAVPGLVNDLMRLHPTRAPAADLDAFNGTSVRADINRLVVAMILVWLLADDWWLAARPKQTALLQVLSEVPAEVVATPAHRFVGDAERREELARKAAEESADKWTRE